MNTRFLGSIVANRQTFDGVVRLRFDDARKTIRGKPKEECEIYVVAIRYHISTLIYIYIPIIYIYILIPHAGAGPIILHPST